MAAGLGFKTFTTGEVLTAADTNGYLMQGVLVFASAAARDAAITSPQEGQCCYLKDTDAVLTYSGSAWVGFDDSNAIQNSIVDAKGDLVAASAADTPARLAVGSNGETLVADSSTSTGLRYQAPIQQNPVINSAFQVWQRGTSGAMGGSGSTYLADRWAMYSGSAGTVSRQTTSDTTNLPNIQYCARVQKNSGEATNGVQQIGTSFETINSIPFAGKTVTFSFYARKGANFSGASDVLSGLVKTGTGTDQNLVGTGYTGSVTAITSSATLTATWQRFTATGSIGSTATEIGIEFRYTSTGTAGANDYFEVTGVQLEVGSVATPFHTYAATIQGELAACQRYYVRFGGNNLFETIGTGLCESTTGGLVPVTLPVTMRIVPSAVDFSTLRLTDSYAVSAGGVTPAIQNNSNSKQYPIVSVSGGTGLTQNRPIFLQTNNSTLGYLGFSAEL
jgi:hypothetical protein